MITRVLDMGGGKNGYILTCSGGRQLEAWLNKRLAVDKIHKADPNLLD
jgi:hypothetical protein